MSNLVRHPYHLVDESPWPILAAGAAFGLTSGLVKWFHVSSINLLAMSLFMLIMVCIQWWRDVSREGSLLGMHSSVVELGLRWGMVLFIVSEVMFFFSFFWAFFHSSLSPCMELGGAWPPVGVESFYPFGVPLLNTIILLSSGFTVTWSHHAIMEGAHKQAIISLGLTLVLGVYFTAIQGLEYAESSFCIGDSSFGSTFFIATGFHGLHVLVGSLFLFVVLLRLLVGSFSSVHHFGMEAAAWYWHFVDVVWLFLFVTIYWWGGAS